MCFFKEKENMMKKRYNLVLEAGANISKLVEQNMACFSADASSETWQSYIEYLDEMVVDGFFQCINFSLNYLLTSTDSKLCQFPLFEARLELQAPDMVFVPSLEFNVSGGFYDLIEEILCDVYQQAGLVKRLAHHYDHNDYLVSLF